jgi:acetyltransferase-like isoleucine patch superfamily enzyme
MRNPRAYAWVPSWAVGLLRGELCRLRFNLLSERVRIGRGFVAECPLHIYGPGRVTIGEHCLIRRSNFQEVTVVTLSPQAMVEIGEHSILGGLRLRAATRVHIGRRFLCGRATITDADHGVEVGGHATTAAGSTAPAGSAVPTMLATPIEIGDDCWLGVGSTVLGGTRLGDNVVVSGASVVGHEVRARSYAMGNPARTVRLAVRGEEQGKAPVEQMRGD